MEIKPNYYDSFKCIATKCKHNCCIGWEIDIDENTLERYKNLSGTLSKELKENISLNPTPHFVLGANERCPFLDKNNLCRLILQGGDDMLCEICKEHPRFYNDVYGVTEKGLGLSCEEAARVILTAKAPFELVGEIKENAFSKERAEVFSVLQNREMPLQKRIDTLLERIDATFEIERTDWVGIFKKLERLDDSWGELLSSIDFIKRKIPENLSVNYEHLVCYFIYRHLSGGLDDLMFKERILFAVLSTYLIANLNKTKTLDEMIEIARMYSGEVEYSSENTTILLEILNGQL